MSGEQAMGIVGAMVEAMSGAELVSKTDVTMAKPGTTAESAAVESPLMLAFAGLQRDIQDASVGARKLIIGAILCFTIETVVVAIGGMYGVAKLFGH